MRSVLAILAVAGLLLVTGIPSLRAQEENSPAPEFSLKDLGGAALSLADYKGKVLVLNFWATWCPPCRAEIPDFIDAYGRLKDKGLEIIGVSVDTIPRGKLEAWIKDAGVNYPVARATAKIVADYKPGDYIPSTIVIDPDGRIRYRSVGVMDKDTLARLFAAYAK
jgi:peroxiredoxin